MDNDVYQHFANVNRRLDALESDRPSVVNLLTEIRDLLLKCSDARELPIDDLGQVIDELRVLLQYSRDLARKLDMVDIGDGHEPSSASVASSPHVSTASTAAATADAPEDTGEAGSSRPASPDLAADHDRLAAAIQKLEAMVKSMHLSAKRGRPLHPGGRS